MTGNIRYRCPACQFPVFNRRVGTCESCGRALPAGFVYSARQLEDIDAEHVRNEKVRARLERARRKTRKAGDQSVHDADNGEGDGDGGGD
jgi:uncharacterized Zn finger protein (UPF0148 family)